MASGGPPDISNTNRRDQNPSSVAAADLGLKGTQHNSPLHPTEVVNMDALKPTVQEQQQQQQQQQHGTTKGGLPSNAGPIEPHGSSKLDSTCAGSNGTLHATPAPGQAPATHSSAAPVAVYGQNQGGVGLTASEHPAVKLPHQPPQAPWAQQPQPQPMHPLQQQHPGPMPSQGLCHPGPYANTHFHGPAGLQAPPQISIPGGLPQHYQSAPRTAPFVAPAAAAGAQGTLWQPIYSRPIVAEAECSCPMVCRFQRQSCEALPITHLSFHVDLHLNFALVRLHLMCKYLAEDNALRHEEQLMFLLPKVPDTTVTQLLVSVKEGAAAQPYRWYPGQVVRDEYLPNTPQGCGCWGQPDDGPSHPTEQEQKRRAIDAELLTMELNACPGDYIEMDVQYYHPLHFDASTGDYVLQLPTTVPENCTLDGANISQVLDITADVHTAVQGLVKLPTCNYTVTPVAQQDAASVRLKVTTPGWPQQDMLLRHKLCADEVTASLQALPDPERTGMQPFVLSLLPPGPESSPAQRSFPRDVVFLFDRSAGSREDPRLDLPKNALLQALNERRLGLEDRFTVVAFNDDQEWWNGELVQAHADSIARCQDWVRDRMRLGGSTDVCSTLLRAMQVLRSAPPRANGKMGLPTVFLIMGVAAEDDARETCRRVQDSMEGRDAGVPIITVGAPQQATQQQPQQPQQPQPRIFTFGIGPYCNHYFLKTLAGIGRGACKHALHNRSINALMGELLDAAARPMLTEVSMRGITPVELYPRRIPDLCIGQPVLVSGAVNGLVPPCVDLQVQLTGAQGPQVLPVTTQLPQSITLVRALQKIMVQQLLQNLTAQAWRIEKNNEQEYKHMRDKIQQLSIEHNIPVSEYTGMLSFQADKQQMEAMENLPNAQARSNYVAQHADKSLMVAGAAVAVSVGVVGLALSAAAVGAALGGADLASVLDPGSCDVCGGDCIDPDACHACFACIGG